MARVFLLDSSVLEANRQALADSASPLQPALQQLLQNAEKQLHLGPWSVTKKDLLPPSGKKNDYCSMGRYWWPDPSKPDGLPYISKDGKPNPDHTKRGDKAHFNAMREAVVCLSYAWFFSGREEFAERAVRVLRVWFLDPEKHMTPHLNYGQGIPGKCEGRRQGIVDSANLVELVDAVGLLAGSKAWTAEDQEGMLAWFSAFLEWLLKSKLGREVAKNSNNLAVQYDAQLVSYALFTGQLQVAQDAAESAKRRIDTQIAADGSQPQELGRATSWNYSCVNLRNFARLARLCSHVQVDLWSYHEHGRSLVQAVEYLLPFLSKPWPHKQINKFQGHRLKGALLLAPKALAYEALALRMLPHNSPERLLYAPVTETPEASDDFQPPPRNAPE